MVSSVRVLGIDPGLAKLGWAEADLYPDRIQPRAMGVVVTKKSGKKRQVLTGDDDFCRTLEVAEALVRRFREPPQVVTVEGSSWPRSSRACQLLGRSWGILGTLVVTHQVPVVQVSPMDIKKALCGVKTASKEDIQTALDARFDYALTPLLKGVAKGLWEHPYDALASIVAALNTPVMRMAQQMAREPR